MKPFAFLNEWEMVVPQALDIDERIEFPVILREGYDIKVLDTVHSIAASGIEDVDINNNEYVFYDRNGFVINAKVFGNVLQFRYNSPMECRAEEMNKYLLSVLPHLEGASAPKDAEALITAVRGVLQSKTWDACASDRRCVRFGSVVVKGWKAAVANTAVILFFCIFGGAAQYLLFHRTSDSWIEVMVRWAPLTWFAYMLISYALGERILRFLMGVGGK